MRNAINCIVVITVLSLGVGMAMGKFGKSDFVLEKDGKRLAVPNSYLPEDRFSWVNSAEGLDSGDLSVVVQIPGGEIDSVIPDEQTPSNPQTVLLMLLSREDFSAIQSMQTAKVEQINQRQGRFSDYRAEFDQTTGFYKFYSGRETSINWYYLRKAPPISASDIIASCVHSDESHVICRIPVFIVNGVGLETEILESQLNRLGNIKGYLSELVGAWISEE